MNAQQIRNAYLDFFKNQNHAVIPRALLVPQNDPTTLFTGSGMQPLIPYLLGEEHPDGTRLADSQTCLRAQDIEEVGDNRHTTFFEMLGNWSLGDYFKQEQFPWIFTFLTDVVGLNPNKLYVTAFLGDKQFNIPKDTESGEIWKKLYVGKGIDAGEVEVGSEADGYLIGTPEGARIFYYDASKNWWCRNGKIADMPVGEPGGPSSEIFYEFDFVEHNTEYGEKCHPNCDCGRFVEIGNSVLMEYKRTEVGFEKLPKKNIDFGGGLERIAMAAINSPDAFKVSVLWPIIEKLEQLSGKKYDSHMVNMRVIADHLRGAAFLAVDGIVPSNKEQGYVMRRLVRRAIMKSFDLGIEQNFLEQIIPTIADLYHADYPEVAAKRDEVIAVLVKEEKVFRQTLRKGLVMLKKLAYPQDGTHGILPVGSSKTAPTEPHLLQIDGRIVFTLYDTYGFPIELTEETAIASGILMQPGWRESFQTHMNKQKQMSQTASKGTFKGGLGGQTMQHRKYHTASHLMYQALRTVLGDHVIQRGSNITEERLRFDFSHDEKMTPEQIAQVETIVNEQIAKDLPVFWKEYPTQQALDMGALGAFGDRYGDVVKIYQMGEGDDRFSFEICGGPHVDHTGQLAEGGKTFKILKEESSSAGVRRIKAALV